MEILGVIPPLLGLRLAVRHLLNLCPLLPLLVANLLYLRSLLVHEEDEALVQVVDICFAILQQLAHHFEQLLLFGPTLFLLFVRVIGVGVVVFLVLVSDAGDVP